MIKFRKLLGIALILCVLCLMLVGCQHTDLNVEITWPYAGINVYATPVLVSGVISDHLASVTINNTPVVVAENGYFIGSVDLVEGENIITIVATAEGQEAVSNIITVIYIPGG